MVGRYRGGLGILALTGVEERQEGRLRSTGSQGLVGDVGGVWDALGLMSSSFRMWGSFLHKQTEVSLVKHSRQVQAIQGHASFQLRGSEQGRQPMERALGCSLLLACVFCHHLLEPHGQ